MKPARQLLRALFSRRSFVRTKQVGKRAGLPNPVDARTLYVVGSPAQWIIFRCPCPEGHDIALDITVNTWRLAGSPRRPTIQPSINSHGSDRRCHFWITGGNVHWCADTYRGTEGLGPRPARRFFARTVHGGEQEG